MIFSPNFEIKLVADYTAGKLYHNKNFENIMCTDRMKCESCVLQQYGNCICNDQEVISHASVILIKHFPEDFI